ncbi:Macrolide export protein MacA [subsurface metagenome]
MLDKGLPYETVAYAQARLDAAEAKLDAMIRSYDTEEVAIKKMEVELAEQSLELAQQSVEQARQSVEQAQKNLNEATLTAPFDGVVASVYADEGDVIPSPTMAPTAIIHLIDLTTMELNIEVDEIDIPGVEVGQRVIIEVDALPALPLEGEVTYISSLAKEEAGVVLYEATIGFDVPEGSGLKAGMSAEADIVIDEQSDVLLVPNRAIKQDSQGNPVVEVMVGKEVQEKPVVIGISDGFDTEIVSGLSEGEVVVVERRAR